MNESDEGERRGESTGGPPDDLGGNGDGPPSEAPLPTNATENTSDESARAVNTSIGLDERGSALAHRLTALALLENTTLDPGRGDARAERYATLLNDTRQYVLDPNRTTSAALFRGDKRVVAPVHQRAPDVAAHLLISESILAETSLDDVERVRAALDDRNISFNESAVATQLAKADRAYRQGERLRQRDPTSPGAVEHYRRAWTHAQRALDIMDEAVVPVVTIHTQEDLPQRIRSNHSVNGTIFDVRGYELAGVLTTNNTSRSLALRASTIPGQTVQFNTTVVIPPKPIDTDTVVDVSVSAVDPGIDVADRGYDSEDEENLHHPQTGRVVVGFDGDALPSDYERTVSRTDPFDPDSDFDGSGVSEADNGVIDGREDVDNDSLNTFGEFLTGTDPFDPDTDDDRLLDGFEDRWPGMNPLVADTDGDGVPDAEEDLDSDQLVNRWEAANETNPVNPDTDVDALNDSVEIERGTNPNQKDTDNDGLTDAEEVALDSNPLDPDSDGDGVRDGNETFSRSVTDDETDVSITVDGQGFPAKGLSVENVSPNQSVDARVSNVVRISNRSTFRTATVTLPIDTEMVTSNGSLTQGTTPSDLTIFKWDPATEEDWRPVPTTVDVENDTVSASVSSFSYFVAADEEAWTDDISLTIEPQWPVLEPFEDLTGWSTEGDVTLGTNGTLVLESKASEDGDDDPSPSPPPEECSVSNASADCDADGLTNGEESQIGTDPLEPDTDGDGLDDGAEQQHDADPLVADTDGDGLEDGTEVNEHETEPDVADTDGGGADDGAEIIVGTDPNDPTDDLINEQTVPEEQTEQPGPTASASRPVALKSGAAAISLRAQLQANVSSPDAVAKVVVETAGTTVTVFELDDGTVPLKTVQADLTPLAGTDATLRIKTSGTARITITHIAVQTDTDGDGLSDAVENATVRDRLLIPVVRENNRGNLSLFEPLTVTEWDDADTDGDGLEDGEEIALEGTVVHAPFTGTPTRLNVEVVSATSHPNFVNSDGMGLTDPNEVENGSKPLVPERIFVGVQFPTQAEAEPGTGFRPTTIDDERVAIFNSAYEPGESSGDSPVWLQREPSIDGEEVCGCRYLQLLVPIYIVVDGATNADYRLPTGVSIELVGESSDDVRVVPEQGPNAGTLILEEGVNVVSVIVRNDDPGRSDSNLGRSIGRFRVGVLTPSDSPFHRKPHTSRERVGNGFAAFTFQETTNSYQVLFPSNPLAKNMVSTAMNRWEEGMRATASVYAPGFVRFRMVAAGTGVGTEGAIFTLETVLPQLVAERRGSLKAEDAYMPELIKVIEEEFGRDAVYAGPVLIREN